MHQLGEGTIQQWSCRIACGQDARGSQQVAEQERRTRLSMNWQSISADVQLGNDVRLSKFINLYGCTIGDETKIGAFVEIQKNATVGKRCKISSHTFICEGVV